MVTFQAFTLELPGSRVLTWRTKCPETAIRMCCSHSSEDAQNSAEGKGE
jgi:hypothetical protein